MKTILTYKGSKTNKNDTNSNNKSKNKNIDLTKIYQEIKLIGVKESWREWIKESTMW